MRKSPARMLYVVLAVCGLFCAMAGSAIGQTGEVNRPLIVTGSGPAPSPELANARDLALQEALRTAVEQGAGRLLPAQRLVRYYPLVDERILNHYMTYVQDYQIIHEATGPQIYRVTAQITLQMERLKRDLQRLGVFLADAERPTVVILVAERLGPRAPWLWWWKVSPAEEQTLTFTQALGQFFSSRGLVPLLPASLLSKIPQDPVYQQPILGDLLGCALGKALGAQIVVLGEVSHQPAEGSASPATAMGSLRAIRTEGGQVLTQAAATVPVQPTPERPAPGHGFTVLAERLGSQLAEAMLAPFVTGAKAPRQITVRVLGVRSYGELLRIKEYLEAAAEVKRVDQLQLTGGQGTVTLLFSGGLEELGGLFQGRDFGAFTTSTDSVGVDSITVSVIKR
jgi:hypothetical protein